MLSPVSLATNNSPRSGCTAMDVGQFIRVLGPLITRSGATSPWASLRYTVIDGRSQLPEPGIALEPRPIGQLGFAPRPVRGASILRELCMPQLVTYISPDLGSIARPCGSPI